MRAASTLTALYEQHSAATFRFALHITGRREDAEDVVQHVFIQAYSILTSGTELVNPRAWFMKAAKHRALNLIRDRRDVPVEEVVIEARPAPDADLDEAEALAAVRAVLWTLPEAQHQAFVLRHWSGLSHNEIADVLSTTTSAVESLLIRARATLLSEHADGSTTCREVRGLLIEARPLRDPHRSHIEGCRRCRTAQLRLRRVAEFAGVFALVPRPHVGHALASAIPGFGTTATAAAAPGAVAGSGAASAVPGAAVGSGGAAVAASAPAAAKAAIVAKALAVALTAGVAVSTVHPLRQPILNFLGRGSHHSTVAAARDADHPRAEPVPPPGPAGPARPAPGSHAGGNGKAKAGSSSHAGGNGKANAGSSSHVGGNGKTGSSANAGGNAKAKAGSSANAGGNGKAKAGSSSNAGGNGKAKGAGGSNAGGNGKAKGSGGSNAGGNGKAKGAGGSNAGGNGKAKGAGGSNAGGNGQAKGTGTAGAGGNGKGKP